MKKALTVPKSYAIITIVSEGQRNKLRTRVHSGSTPLVRFGHKTVIKITLKRREKTMARKIKYVTRTIKFTEANCVTLSLHDNSVTEKVLSVAGTLDGDKLITALRATYETDFDKIVAVKTSETKERLFAIPESVFLTNGVELDPKTRKPISTNDDVEIDIDDTDETPDETPEEKPKKNKK